jgi:hypothetical protein
MDRRAANPQLAGDLRRSYAIRRQGPHLGSLGHGDGLATLGRARGRAFGVVLLLALKRSPALELSEGGFSASSLRTVAIDADRSEVGGPSIVRQPIEIEHGDR